MEIANILLSLGGDNGNQVPKYGVSPSEVAILRFIHGDDAVAEIEITGDQEISHRNERSRLLEAYGKRVDDRVSCEAVEMLFPGIAAPMFDTFDQLEIPEDFYKSEHLRVKPKAKIQTKPKTAPKRKDEVKTDPEPEIEADLLDEQGDEDEGQDMPDNDMFK
jgi:hypothetical protein